MQELHRGVLQEIKGLQEQEHALQKESLNVRLKVEQIDTAIAECQNKIKHWEKEVSALTRQLSSFLFLKLCKRFPGLWFCLNYYSIVLVYYFLPPQSTKLALHSIDDKSAEELPKLTTEQLVAIKSPDVIKNEIALLEDRCAQMKPNLGAIAEFKKKVCGHCFEYSGDDPPPQIVFVISFANVKS